VVKYYSQREIGNAGAQAEEQVYLLPAGNSGCHLRGQVVKGLRL